MFEGERPPPQSGLSCVMILPGSHRSLTGCVISLVGSSKDLNQIHFMGFFGAHASIKVPGLGFGLPWEGLAVGLHPATVPPNSDHSDKSHRAQRAASSGVYRSAPHDGCTATRGYSETSRGRCGLIPYPCDKQTAGRRWMQQIVKTGQSRQQRGDKDAGEVQLTAAKTPNEGERLRCRRANACYVATNMETISPYLSHFG